MELVNCWDAETAASSTATHCAITRLKTCKCFTVIRTLFLHNISISPTCNLQIFAWCIFHFTELGYSV